MKRRKVFDHLHEELSVLVGRLVPRMELWEDVKSLCFDPETLNKEEAAYFLRQRAADFLPEIPAKGLRKVIKKFERWNPLADTPDEIMERICSGFGR